MQKEGALKQSPDLDKIQESLKPGVITLHGFLGSDDRKLIDILIEDNGKVRRLNLTHEVIAARMAELRDAGKKGLGEFISVDPHFDVRVDSVRGKLPSPFGGPGLYRKINTTVKNRKLNKSITYTDLSIHMIKDHGFYEGKGSVFRLEPEDLKIILEIQEVE
jgi:hypothetical protein